MPRKPRLPVTVAPPRTLATSCRTMRYQADDDASIAAMVNLLFYLAMRRRERQAATSAPPPTAPDLASPAPPP
jgi:hypothetical protein